MSIKKTPICPFCKTEMTREKLEFGTLIPTKIQSLPPIQGWTIQEWIVANVYICEGCGFIALWRGEP